MRTIDGLSVKLLTEEMGNLEDILLKNRAVPITEKESYFKPDIRELFDPFLLPDMKKGVERILLARKNQERIVIFGDYDVDGVSGTTILVRFLREIGCEVSFRLPHRSKDGYGLKSYFLDELKEKEVKLVITVDCGTRDIEAIKHAKELGIDVLVTDHHAVPDIIPEEAIGIINPKRGDSIYPFSGLAGTGVAFKLVHGILRTIEKNEKKIYEVLQGYIDFASLGTVADCMPLISENRVITTLGLIQMKNSRSAGLKKFLEGYENIAGNADIIGFHIGPRINASGRMDTPLTALKWLLASEEKCDEYLREIEALNKERQEIVKVIAQKALIDADPDEGILFFTDPSLEHGLIGLVAGKLTEAYYQPSIVLTEQKDESDILVASCRSPEWCNLISLLDEQKDFFVRYGGHRQAAGFSIERKNLLNFQETLKKRFFELYGKKEHFPTKTLQVECLLDPNALSLKTIELIEMFQPFGIGNPKPRFLLQDVTLTSVRSLGNDGQHLSFFIQENPHIKFLLWRCDEKEKEFLREGNIVSLIIMLEKNSWNGKTSIQCTLEGILTDTEQEA